jgi:Fe-S cluster assembly iron-binding protein IscA
MLALTETAADVIRQLTEAPVADGVRISTAGASVNGHGPNLLIELVPGPAVDDEVVEAAGARIYLEPGAMRVLDHMVLDADVEGDEVRFAILEQPDEDELG